MTCRRLAALLFACAALPVAPAQADAVVNPAGVFAVGSQPISNTSTFNIADCAGNTVTINPVGTTAGAGATTFSDTTYSPAKTQIDWSQAYSATGNYMATYVACNNTSTGTFESPVTYEVRWNITSLSSTTKLVVIGASTTTRSYPSARSTLAADRMPPSK